jgi:hypothetical protein
VNIVPEVAHLPAYAPRSLSDTLNEMNNPPQQISRQAIEEFKAIYLEEFGQTITDDDAQEMGVRLLQLFAILAQPPENGTNNPQCP